MIRKNRYFLAAFILFSFITIRAAHAVPNQNIKIGVALNVTSGQLLGKGLSLRDASGHTASLSSGAAVTADGGYVRVGLKRFKMPLRVTGGSGLGWDKTRYRGTLTLISSPQSFTVVNELDLESYLRGILKIEMNPEWPREALKAQAVLARTFAVKNKGRFAAKGYDLDATEMSQVYRGINAEDPRTDAAVSATEGQVLLYSGQVASVYYHSDSGGSTADVSHVWGGSMPYLSSRQEAVAYASPYSNWTLTLSPAQIQTALSKLKVDVGSVRGVQVALKDTSGRAVQLRVNGDRGSSDVRAHAFRMAVGSGVLRSTNFDIPSGAAAIAAAGNPPALPAEPAKPAAGAAYAAEYSPKTDPLIELTQSGVFTKDEMMDMLMNPEKRDEYLKKGLARVSGGSGAGAPPAKPASPSNSPKTPSKLSDAGGFTFVGKGWGHGVGLSQWGAKAMAEQGASCEAILSHYFPGTKIAE